jgi:hypothetical protein
MRLNEQRNRLIDGIVDASTDLKYMRSAILRKIASPYGDGSKSNMVNAETDVLPRLVNVLDLLQSAMNKVHGDFRCHTFGSDDADRLKSKSARIF